MYFMRYIYRTLLVVTAVVCTIPASADDELAERATWAVPQPGDAKQTLDNWLAKQELDELAKLKIEALWPEQSPPKIGLESLYRFAESVGVVDGRAAEMVKKCHAGTPSPRLVKQLILEDESLAIEVRANLRLLYGTWLAQYELYDEAQVQLQGLKPQDVVDPASLLFYQGVVNHRLLKKDPCLAALDTLMQNENEIPRRYSTVAHLMVADIRPLETDSLDEIARLMDDVKRRLKVGRAGKTVQKVEHDVVAKLDKMIEEMEEAAKKKRQAPGSGAAPSQPLPDSTPAGGTGPGEVDPRRLNRGSGWGNLPQKERDEVLQQISKDLPAHYREVIREYFRKIARDAD